MHREDALSVRVHAPSRGLIARWPASLLNYLATGGAKFLGPGPIARAAAAASNVRYEDGEIKAAPGYQLIKLDVSLLDDILAHWPLDELTGSRFDTSGHAHTLLENGPVTWEKGILKNAALFIALQASPPTSTDHVSVDTTLDSIVTSLRKVRVHDWVTFDLTLASGFKNPYNKRVHDFGTVNQTLFSGAHTLVIGPIPNVTDHVSVDQTTASGNYFLVIVVQPAPTDHVSVDQTTDSGIYFLVIVVTTVSDHVSADLTTDSGVYTKTIVGPETVTDHVSLTTTLDSGSYSM